MTKGKARFCALMPATAARLDSRVAIRQGTGDAHITVHMA